ncbi:hypothetical protein VNI00_018744 [Paramarasmius palmivorus]|uniref:Uncharacterized protein n=1 Tax=Paramarasmius palmivorus TaxID=297713 RepID=A0AAW0AUC3_9AGAR
MKYLESDDELPTERLEDIIRIRADDLPGSPYPDLDLLYRQVLETCHNWQEVRKILRLLVTIPRVNLANFIFPSDPWRPTLNRIYHSPECIGTLLDCKAGRVQSLLFKLHSVITVPMDSHEDMQIPHVSFTEFLLDSTRSREYHVEPYTETVYYDLVAQAFLHVLSIRSLEYPCRVSQSVPLWDNWDFLNSGLSLLSVFHLVRYLMSPSAKLLEALDQFDPYCFATGLLMQREDSWQEKYRSFEFWIGAIQWANALGTQAPEAFLNRMEAFLQRFCIGSPRASTLQLSALSFMEQAFYMPRRTSVADPFILRLPRHILLGKGEDFRGQRDIYVLSADQAPPSSWSIVTSTSRDRRIVSRLLASLAMCSLDGLFRDVYQDTYNSVYNLGQDKQDDLYSLKQLVVQRQQELGIPPIPCTALAQTEDEAGFISDDTTSVEDFNEISEVSTRQRRRKREASPSMSSSRKRLARGNHASGQHRPSPSTRQFRPNQARRTRSTAKSKAPSASKSIPPVQVSSQQQEQSHGEKRASSPGPPSRKHPRRGGYNDRQYPGLMESESISVVQPTRPTRGRGSIRRPLSREHSNTQLIRSGKSGSQGRINTSLLTHKLQTPVYHTRQSGWRGRQPSWLGAQVQGATR